MISSIKSTYSQLTWAENRNGILIQKFGKEIDKAIAEQREKDIAATEAFMKKHKKTGGKFELTNTQIETLSANFDPNSMSYQEYMSFIDLLCEYGVLDEGDKDYVSYNMAGKDSDLVLIPLKFDIPISTWGPISRMGYDNSFESSRGNVLGWASHLAQFETFNTQTQSYEKTRTAILYGKIRDVLLKITP